MSGRILAVKADTRILDERSSWRERVGSEQYEALLIGSSAGALDPSAVAAALSASTDVSLVVEAAVGEHDPYNLARRILTLQRLHRARVSVLLTPGGVDPLTLTARELAGESDDSDRLPPAEIWREFVHVLRALWASFPLAHLTADQDSGVFAETGAVARVDFSGDTYRVAGPLNAPLDELGLPFVYARVTKDTQTSLLEAFVDEADALIGDLSPSAWERITDQVRTRRAEAQILRSVDAAEGDSRR